MKAENIIKLNKYLDIVEAEMDKVAKLLGRPTREEFFSEGFGAGISTEET